jgi:hypothetical protein
MLAGGRNEKRWKAPGIRSRMVVTRASPAGRTDNGSAEVDWLGNDHSLTVSALKALKRLCEAFGPKSRRPIG